MGGWFSSSPVIVTPIEVVTIGNPRGEEKTKQCGCGTVFKYFPEHVQWRESYNDKPETAVVIGYPSLPLPYLTKSVRCPVCNQWCTEN
jgi:hypothetical protein